MPNTVLVTGGAGYIGSHTCLALLSEGFDVIVLDNLCNSSKESIHRIERIANKSVEFIEGDIRNEELLTKIFEKRDINTVLHFAGLKAVGESVRKPLEYYDNNFTGSLKLLQAMAKFGVYQMVFSSSATVYGSPEKMPISEDSPTSSPTNPYGQTKLMVEQALKSLADADTRWKIAILRYFNPVGAHSSGLIGEDPNGIPNNLLPYISQVGVGRLSELSVFGNDYPTPDGTGIRDYIHVVDLANGHIKALQAIRDRTGVNIWNLGTGIGYSVLEMINAFERVSGLSIPYRFVSRRQGDIAECWADSSKAEQELGWKAKEGLNEMVADTWRWQSLNPRGYKSPPIK